MTPYARLRLIAFAEAFSWATLLTGMILKYGFGYLDPVFLAGSIHGGLFMLFLLAAVDFGARRPRVPVNYWYFAAIASVVPFGTLAFDWWLGRLRTGGGSGLRPRSK